MRTTLGSVGVTYGGLAGKVGKDFGHGEGQFVTFTEVMASPRLTGKSLARVDVRKGERQNAVRRGDVLFNGSSETPEEVALAAVVDFDPPKDVFLNSFCFGYRLTRSDQIDPAFLALFFRSKPGREIVFGLAQGATRYNIAKTKLLQVPLQLPEFEEQQRTAAQMAECDDLVISYEKLISKKRDVKQSLVQQLLTGSLRLPGFNDEWQPVCLGDHVTYVKSVALSRAQLDSSSSTKCLHYGDIHTRHSIRLDADSEELPRSPAHLVSTAGFLRTGDLVFADASEDPAGVGKSVEITSVPAEGVVAGLHTIAARFDKRVLSDGFKGYLQFIGAFRSQLLGLAAGTKVLATTRKYISSIELRLPGIEEQQAITEVLLDVDNDIASIERRLKAVRAIRQGMMQTFFVGGSGSRTEDAL